MKPAIDMHNHWYPDALVEALRARNTPPHIDRDADGKDVLHYPGMSSGVRPGYTDLDKRVEGMDRYGVEALVLSLGNRMLNALQSAPAEISGPLTRINNDGLSEACQRYPGRFYGLGFLPYADMDAAVAELDRAMRLDGIIGVTVPGNAFLSLERAERFRPLFAAGDRLGAHFLVHDCYRFEDFADPPETPADSFALREETLETQGALSQIMVTLCMSDILDDYPNLSVQVHNLGGNLPLEISRMDHLHLFKGKPDPLPSTRCRRVHVDCNSYGADALELGVKLYGADRIMFGTDGSDFGTQWSFDAIRDARITDEERDLILNGTARTIIDRAKAAKDAVTAA